MMMKKILLSLLCGTVMAATAFSQTTDWKKRYESLVARVGADGVGVETTLNNWEKDDSLNTDMLKAKSDYYYLKSKTSEIVAKSEKKYLGRNPVMELKDSAGAPVYYFQERVFDEELLAKSFKYIDKVISLNPEKIDIRAEKITTLVEYEKDSPDMAFSELMKVIDDDNAGIKWTYGGAELLRDDFHQIIQEYCYLFYSIGTPTALNAFKTVSEKMLSKYPQMSDYMDNIAAYYVATKDLKKGLKMYDKALKIKPDDMTAIKSCVNIALLEKDKKLMKKYLPMMAKYGNETEKLQAQIRLDSLK